MLISSTRMDAVQTPVIPIVQDMIRQHPGTISLGQGVVSYSPPTEAIDRITEFLSNPQNHKYQSLQGISPLLEAIAVKLQAENHVALPNRQVVVTAGSNMGFLNAVLAITNPGNEVILQVPYYFNHEMAIAIAGCRAVLVHTDQNYQLRPEAIEAAITKQTRAIVTISPNNPTGVVYPEATLRTVNQICRAHSLYHIHDEAYEYFTYDDVTHFSPGAIADSAPYTISLYSLSKAYGFASWRIGYMVIPEELLMPMMKIQDTNVICPAVVSQYAALGALQAGRKYCQERLAAIATNRQLMLQTLAQVKHLCTVPPSNGAFYLFLKIHTRLSAMQLVERMIRKHGVAALPGDTFGIHDGCYLRVAYAALEQNTAIEGIQRLVRGLKQEAEGA